ncbi:YfiR family protein [Marinobacter caseinilyticus]|uniref:YfiR family protein n=1 Tax=Marinobacter caseinilyticus TaxID=2692195 RepID=UPI00140AA3C3|nr:YfiR family protein [Marinobacter caseinilyticus]
MSSNTAGGYFLPLLKYFVALLLCAGLLSAQASVRSEYEVKAAFLYNFTRFISWTEQPDNKAALKVCVIGDTPFGNLLQPLAGRTSQGRALEITNPDNIAAKQGCNVVFVSESESRNLPAIIAQAEAQKIITISDIPNFVDSGGIIGYVKQGNVIRFEINLLAANAVGLNINSRLLELASRVIR